MRGSRGLVVSLISILVAAAGPAAAGSVGDDTWAGPLTAVNDRIGLLRSDIGRVRGELQAGDLLSVVRATAAAANRSGAAEHVASIPSPEGLVQAARGIARAAARATAIVRASRAAKLGDRLGLDRVRALLSRAVIAPETVSPTLPRFTPGPALRAAALLASAVDASLPVLDEAAAARSPQQRSAVACDVLDRSPDLCVGGMGTNSYTDDQGVIIDLGGNDTYQNNAGGSPNNAGQVVALVLDLSGNDTYAPPADRFMVEGGAAVGGIGMLADLSGNDTYAAVANTYRTRSGGVFSETAGAQGQGAGALGGAGFLFDAAGNDTYGVETTARGTSAGSAGQGEGFFGGAGTLVDGGGDDSYSATATALPLPTVIVNDEDGKSRHVTQYGNAGVAAQAFSGIFEGTGLLADSGGADSFTLSARLAGSPPDADPLYMPDSATGLPNVGVSGQGLGGFGGASLLLEGSGPTTYTMTADADPTPTTEDGVPVTLFGQGAGGLAAGALSDTGGDDTYTASASTSASVAATAVDGCSPCPTNVNAAAGALEVDVQGVGLAGSGLLEDGGGNDRYVVSGSSESALSLDDRRSVADEPMVGTSMAGAATSHAQGYGGAGTGELSDTGGNDVYAANLTTHVQAEASSALPSNRPDVSSAASTLLVDGQGSGPTGAGALHDVGGSDTYRETASSTETPAAGSPASVTVSGQGAADANGLGVAVDIDGTGTDTYVQIPPDPTCSGTRGQGVWKDCGNVGIGVNA